MRSNTSTRSINSESIKSMISRCAVSMAVLGNTVRSLLDLTFLREGTGYQPQPAEPDLKRHSPNLGYWCFRQQSDKFVELLGLTRFAISATRLVPVAAQPAAMDLIRVQRPRRKAIR